MFNPRNTIVPASYWQYYKWLLISTFYITTSKIMFSNHELDEKIYSFMISYILGMEESQIMMLFLLRWRGGCQEEHKAVRGCSLNTSYRLGVQNMTHYDREGVGWVGEVSQIMIHCDQRLGWRSRRDQNSMT